MRIGSVNSYQNNYQLSQTKQNEKETAKAGREVASGKKINSAGDNSSAMAVSQEMLKQLKALQQSTDNISEGTSVTNITDSAMSSISDNLQDIEGNSVRAMNGTLSDSDRAMIQQSVNGSLDTINSVAQSAQYNEKSLLTGSAGNISIATADGQISITGNDMTTDGLGLSGYSVKDGTADMDTLSAAFDKLTSARSTNGAQSNALSSAYNGAQNAIQNTTASYSQQMDADMTKAISRYKQSAVMNSVQEAMQKKQMQAGTVFSQMI